MSEGGVMSDEVLLTRDEVLGGLPARRAAALLFLIESRTAHLVDRARHAMDRFRTEEADRERELAYVEAFALGREPPLKPTIQDLERFAPQWADLVPENPRLRAAVAHTMGHKYDLVASAVTQLRDALGMDTDAVRDAYQRLYKTPLESIYATRPSLRTRLRWAWSAATGKLESLPPFWTAFALTLTETVGAGVLALPIALAGVGPVPGIVMLVVFGLVNVLTVAWLAETASRTANIRYGGAYFGRMVTQYLGVAGAFLLTIALVTIAVVMSIAYAIGFATTLSSVSGLASPVWVAILFVVVAWIVSRDSMSSTVASALAIGAVNMSLVIALAALGIAHVSSGNLTHVQVPGLGDTPFELGFLGLIFGVILSSYFGHTSVGNCAAVVLQRDPSGRALIWGVAAAQVTAIAIYSTWILGANGAVSPEVMEREAGTALQPLADVAGPAVHIFGTVFVVLAMGMGAIHMATCLINAVRERLPHRVRPVVLLPRESGRIVLVPRGRSEGRGPRIVLTYLGLDGDRPKVRAQARASGRVQRVDETVTDTWDVLGSFDRLPDSVLEGRELTVRVVSADGDQARLEVISNMQAAYEGDWSSPGIDLAGLLDPDPDGDPDADLLRWMLRQGQVTLEEAAAWSGASEETMSERLRSLVDRGAVRTVARNGETLYRASVARRRARQVSPLLDRAIDRVPARGRGSTGEAVRDAGRRAVGFLLGDIGRRIIEFAPLLLVVTITEWLVLTDRASFAQTLSFCGVIAVPIFAGIFPCLLIVSSRRKGDIAPGVVSRVLGWPALIATVYVLFLLGILLHGLFIWDQPMERAAAIVATVILVVVTALAIRRGAFASRTVLMLRDDRRRGEGPALEIVSGGMRAEADIRLEYLDGTRELRASAVAPIALESLRGVTTTLPSDRVADVKVWAKRVTPDGTVESLPARLWVGGGDNGQEIDLRLAGGTVVLAAGGSPGELSITLDQPSVPIRPTSGSTTKGVPSNLAALHTLTNSESDLGSTRAKGESA